MTQLRGTFLVIVVGLLAIQTVFGQVEKSPPSSDSHFILVQGAGGEEEYSKAFQSWMDRWKKAADQRNAKHTLIGVDSVSDAEKSDREQLKEAIERAKAVPTRTVWLVLIGHGTFDGKQAKFNLRGRDISAQELKQQLAPLEQNCVIVCCFSCSGAFVPHLSGEKRVVIASTRNGVEYNFSRFGDYLSRSIADATIDLDKDEETSILEAFLVASKQTAEFYQSDARIQTEHPVIDDNGDGQGTAADSFRGVRSGKKPQSGNQAEGVASNQMVIASGDPRKATLTDPQLKQRRSVEIEIEKLRSKKESMTIEEYLIELEALLLKLPQAMTSDDVPQNKN